MKERTAGTVFVVKQCRKHLDYQGASVSGRPRHAPNAPVRARHAPNAPVRARHASNAFGRPRHAPNAPVRPRHAPNAPGDRGRLRLSILTDIILLSRGERTAKIAKKRFRNITLLFCVKMSWKSSPDKEMLDGKICREVRRKHYET